MSHISQNETPINPDHHRENNFRFLRFLAAIIVVLSHASWVVYGKIPENDGFLQFIVTLSHCAVCLFFAISGFLIANSLIRRNDLISFILGRLLRLVPALFVVSVLLALVIGPLVSTSTINDYFFDPRPLLYIFLSSLSYPDMTLPGVFETAPSRSEVNISLWTLRYEILAYFAMGFLAFTGLLSSRYHWVWLSAALIFYFWITFATDLRASYAFVDHGLRFGLQFLFGVGLYLLRDKIPLHLLGCFAVITLAMLTNSTPLMEPLRLLAIAYLALWLALVPSGKIRQFNRLGDYSYGLFLYHWPIAQILWQVFPDFDYLTLLLALLPISLGFAIFSWHFIEAPMLAKLEPWRTQIAAQTESIMTKGKHLYQQIIVGPKSLDTEDKPISSVLSPRKRLRQFFR